MTRGIYLGLGGNLLDVLATFRSAVDCMPSFGIEIVAAARAYRTPPLRLPGDVEAMPDFWNTVIEVSTQHDPQGLLDVAMDIERAHGRVRKGRWKPRTLDIDILLFGEEQVIQSGLTIPHPEIAARMFVLMPLFDLAPKLMIPGLGRSVTKLLAAKKNTEREILEEKNWYSATPAQQSKTQERAKA